MTNQHQSFNELYRRIIITTSTRYSSAIRLSFHQRSSQWVTALVSVALIVIPLLKAMKVPLNHPPQLLDAIEVILAVLVLVYSLLLGNENYSGRAEKMQSCALALGRLSRKIYPYLNQPHDQNIYANFSQEYHDILEKYPNHDPIDYKLYRLSKADEYYPNEIIFMLKWTIVKLESITGYWHYIIVATGVVLTILSMFKLFG
jgi:hypothetical protein